MKIVSIGEITIDHYLDLNQTFVGGISLNFAVHAKRSGADVVSLISCVGTDVGGHRVLSMLSAEGVDASHLKVVEGETASIDITVTPEGERIFPAGGYHHNALGALHLDDSDIAFIHEHDILVFRFDRTNPAMLINRPVGDVAFAGLAVVDVGGWAKYAQAYGDGGDALLTLFAPLDLVFISGDQATVETLLPLSKRFEGLFVITMGAAGSIALLDGQPLFQPAIPVPAATDSTGCGDAFQAAFTVAYADGAPIVDALRCGAEQAAIVVQRYGAI
ncbi:MAG: PfkB family carbohydrate kinase [Chloroflexota bacterium]